jgi:hypothetical protein
MEQPLGAFDLRSVQQPSLEFTKVACTRSLALLVPCLSVELKQEFVEARDAMPKHLLGFITRYSMAQYEGMGAQLFLTTDRCGGFAIANGLLCSVFSHPGRRYGDELCASAVALGATHLTCYDHNGFLSRLYERHGFFETSRESWSRALAPADWDYSRWGEPDYVTMERR